MPRRTALLNPLRTAVRVVRHAVGRADSDAVDTRSGLGGLGMTAVAAMPMEPQVVAGATQPWFEGWFFRFTDHEAAVSVAVIFGSLRKRRRRRSSKTPLTQKQTPPFDEHLLVLAYAAGNGTGASSQDHSVIIDDAESVRLTGGSATHDASPQVTWWSDVYGGMRVDGDSAIVDVRLPTGLRLAANVSGSRVLWDPLRPNQDGPEGWLSRTQLLPCHYFVHTFGSRATYELRHSGNRALHLAGTSFAHIERNWGDAFPSGWVWAQASARAGSAFLVLTGGRFVIGPLTVDSYVIGLRIPRRTAIHAGWEGSSALSWDFRTTDLDRVSDVRRPCDGLLALNATSRDRRRRLELLLTAAPASFGARIPVPTLTDGFSANPGCRESYKAHLTIRLYGTEVEGSGPVVIDAQMAVLEFGGEYQC